MARPKKTDVPDTNEAVGLTVGAIERLTCTPGKKQDFLRDTKAPGLRVRVTSTGAKSFVFERKLNRQTIRRTLGDVKSWTIEQARTEARRLGVMLDNGTDPRELERQQHAEREALRQRQEAEATTAGAAWAAYLEERRPHWGERHFADHLKMSQPGGEPSKRNGNKPTTPGPIHELLGLRLADVTALTVEAWSLKHGKVRPTYARLCWRCLKAFLAWCNTHTAYASLLPDSNPAATKKAREALGRPGAKSDALQREQLPAWFAAVRNIPNPTTAAALQVMLLTGARPGEVLAMRWEDVNTRWRGLTLRDKDNSKGGADGVRTIPLTPYVAHLLAGLPHRNEYVFASGRAASMSAIAIKRREQRAKDGTASALVNEGGKGYIAPPGRPHTLACKVAGIDNLSLHGLRRSFGSLSEWVEVPAGIAAQIQGHKPSGTAEKHYRVRPLDLLRMWHDKIEAWMLEQAGVEFDAQAEPGKLGLAVA